MGAAQASCAKVALAVTRGAVRPAGARLGVCTITEVLVTEAADVDACRKYE